MATISHFFKSVLASTYWFRAQGKWRIRDVFNDVYEGQAKGQHFRSIFRETFGDEYAEEADPTGFLTMTDLANITRELAVGPDQTFVDLACGRGGGGLWIARQTGAQLVGIDISDVAVAAATARVSDFGLDGRARFQTGDFAATGLGDSVCDGAMSVDSLFLVPDKRGSVHETARILRPGARFVFTTWEVDLPLMIKDYHAVLASAGFQVERYEETTGWRERQKTVHERILAEQATLKREMGDAGAEFWIVGAKTELARLSRMRRVLIVARKSG